MTTRDTLGRSIAEAEDLLLSAMRTSDVPALDALLATDLSFTLPDGSTIGKNDDLASHRTGATRFERITEVERTAQAGDDSGETTTVVDAVIMWNGDRIESTLTYTRSWRIIEGRWQVVSGSARAS